MNKSPKRWMFAVLALAVLLSVPVLVWLGVSERGQAAWRAVQGHSQRDWIRHALRRLEGHPRLEALAVPPLRAWQRRIEREPPATVLPTLGKGQLPGVLPPWPGLDTPRTVNTAQELQDAMREARPGTAILIAPGRYRLTRTLKTGHHGRAEAPIAVRADTPGTVHLEFGQVEGVLVDKAHWLFENLQIEGVCARDDDCEHAFHVVGEGRHVVIRNNTLRNFNAPVKVNGLGGAWPDHGLLAHNTLVNDRPRATARPVTMLDLVGASHWRVQDNHVTHFVKRGGNRVSYGLFAKGGGQGVRFERNLVICTPQAISQPGVRVGISFGGGGTSPSACRDAACREAEHRFGLAANNIVAHCNDSGIDLNRAIDIQLLHNTLVNTGGIGARRGSAGRAVANLGEGGHHLRDGSSLDTLHETSLDEVFEPVRADRLDWTPRAPAHAPRVPAQLADHFGPGPRPTPTPPGAIHFVN